MTYDPFSVDPTKSLDTSNIADDRLEQLAARARRAAKLGFELAPMAVRRTRHGVAYLRKGDKKHFLGNPLGPHTSVEDIVFDGASLPNGLGFALQAHDIRTGETFRLADLDIDDPNLINEALRVAPTLKKCPAFFGNRGRHFVFRVAETAPVADWKAPAAIELFMKPRHVPLVGSRHKTGQLYRDAQGFRGLLDQPAAKIPTLPLTELQALRELIVRSGGRLPTPERPGKSAIANNPLHYRTADIDRVARALEELQILKRALNAKGGRLKVRTWQGEVWFVDLVSTRCWLKIVVSLVLRVGSTSDALELVDQLSNTTGLSSGAKEAVSLVYDKIGNENFVRGVLLPEDFYELTGDTPVTVRTWAAALSAAKRVLGIHSTQVKMREVNAFAKLAKQSPAEHYDRANAEIRKLRGASQRFAEKLNEALLANGGKPYHLTPSKKVAWADELGIKPTTLQVYVTRLNKVFLTIGGHHHKDGDTIIGWRRLESAEANVDECKASPEGVWKEAEHTLTETYETEEHDTCVADLNTDLDPDRVSVFCNELIAGGPRDLSKLACLEFFKGPFQDALEHLADRAEKAQGTGPNTRLMNLIASIAEHHGPTKVIEAFRGAASFERTKGDRPAERRNDFFDALCWQVERKWLRHVLHTEAMMIWRKQRRFLSMIVAQRNEQLHKEERRRQADLRESQINDQIFKLEAMIAYQEARDPDAALPLKSELKMYRCEHGLRQ